MSCKLFLVPEDVIQTWRTSQRTDQIDKPVQTSISQMDSSMQKILKDKSISDYDKEKMYNQKMATFVDMRDQQATEIPLDSVPKQYKTKANALLNYMKSDKDVEWDDQARLILKGKVIPTSNIVDLIHDGLRMRKKAKRPVGWKELSRHFAGKNIPTELIGNEEWKTPPASPVKVTPSVRRPVYKRAEAWTPYTVKKRIRQRASKIKGRQQVRRWIDLKDV